MREDEKRCRNCRHWMQFTNDYDDLECGKCKKLTDAAYRGTWDGCRVHDASGPITTEANFGCIHYAVKLYEGWINIYGNGTRGVHETPEKAKEGRENITDFVREIHVREVEE